MSGTTVRPAAGSSRSASPRSLRLPFSLTPVGAVIAAATLLALGLRAYQLARPGHLLGVGDYDDGADFGSAIWLVHGVLPYRDFVLVQPPGITVLMAPAALLSKVASTAWAIAAARILTALAGAAAVVLGGLLVRHRGVLATLLTCGIIAIYPGSVQAAHTVLLEPWLTAFCLAGALAVFDGDRLASGWRLAWGGAALGFAGAIKVWAIIPVAVILVFCLRRPRQAARFVAGVAAGFLIPVVPFAALAPRRFYDSVVAAQLARTGSRIPLGFRLQYLTGMTGWLPATAVFLTVAVVMALVVAGTIVAAWRVTRRGPAPLEWFALWTAVLVTVAFMVPVDFYYHYAGFLAPFLALAFALPAARLMDAWEHPPGWVRRSVIPVTGLVILVLPLAVPRAENSPTPTYSSALPGRRAGHPARGLRAHRRGGAADLRGPVRVRQPGLPGGDRRHRHQLRAGQRAQQLHRGPCSGRGLRVAAGVPGRAVRADHAVQQLPDRVDAPAQGVFPGPLHPGQRGLGATGALRTQRRVASALSERPDHQPGPRLGAERG